MNERKGKIKFRLIAAVTLDGKIAHTSRHLTDWTSKEDKDFLHKKLDESNAVIVGNNTYKTARKPLAKRNCIVITHSVENTKQISKNCLYLNPKNVNIIEALKEKKYQLIDVLGGAQVYSWFLERNLFDDIYLTIEPIIFGSGLSLFDVKVKQIKYNLKSVKKLNNKGSILLHYTKV